MLEIERLRVCEGK